MDDGALEGVPEHRGMGSMMKLRDQLDVKARSLMRLFTSKAGSPDSREGHVGVGIHLYDRPWQCLSCIPA